MTAGEEFPWSLEVAYCGRFIGPMKTSLKLCGYVSVLPLKLSLWVQGGYRGFYCRNTIDLNPKVVNDIHKRGGTILCTSRGGHENSKIVDSIEDRGINQVSDAVSILNSSNNFWRSEKD
jgi:6-phosphofructokinase 1